MNTNTAVAIAAALERKLGEHIAVSSNDEVLSWSNGDRTAARPRDTNENPMEVARDLVAYFSRPKIPKPKKKVDDD